MPDILIRGLAPQTLKRLKTRAKRNGRSLQQEAQRSLEQSANAVSDEVAAMFDKWKQRFKGRRFSNSVRLIREDRNR